jgi:hypothetical protein
MHQGVLLVRQHMITMTILSHPGQDELVAAATKVVTSSALSPSG